MPQRREGEDARCQGTGQQRAEGERAWEHVSGTGSMEALWGVPAAALALSGTSGPEGMSVPKRPVPTRGEGCPNEHRERQDGEQPPDGTILTSCVPCTPQHGAGPPQHTKGKSTWNRASPAPAPEGALLHRPASALLPTLGWEALGA